MKAQGSQLRLIKEDTKYEPSTKVLLASRKAHIKDLVTQLEDSLASGEHASVKVLGCEDTITKAITVVEIVIERHFILKHKTYLIQLPLPTIKAVAMMKDTLQTQKISHPIVLGRKKPFVFIIVFHRLLE